MIMRTPAYRCFFMLWLWLWLTMLPVFAQSVPTSVYLSGFRNSKALSSFDNYAQQVRALNYSLPKVDEINLRTETDQFNLSRQEYALRVMFNGWNAGKSYAAEQEWLSSKIEARKDIYGAEMLLGKYYDLVDLHHYIALTQAYENDSVFVDSMIWQTIHHVVADQKADVNDLLNWEQRKSTLHKKLLSARSSVSLLHAFTGVLSFDWSTWPDVAFMENLLNNYAFPGLSEAKSRAFAADSVLVNDRWAVSRKNDHRLLDYAQLRYSKRDNLLFQDEFSIGMGFRLPYKGTQKKQSNDYRIELFDLQQEKTLELAEKENAVNDAKKKFNLLLIQWKNYITEPAMPASVNLANPEVFNVYRLEMKKETMELREKKMEVEKKITEQYLYTLYLLGEMEKTPCTDFLSTLLPVF